MAEWTEQDDAELKRLKGEGVPTADIGRKLGRSKNSIIGRCHRLGLSNPDAPQGKGGRAKKTVQQRAFDLYEKGYRHDAIARFLGITATSSRTFVCCERRARGIEPFKPVGFHANRVVKQAEKAMKPRKLIRYAGAE